MAMPPAETPRELLSALGDEDLGLVWRFALADGSIKDLAASLGVSYPTMRARLDELLARLRRLQEGRRTDPFDEALAELIERGQLPASAARKLRELHRSALAKEQR